MLCRSARLARGLRRYRRPLGASLSTEGDGQAPAYKYEEDVPWPEGNPGVLGQPLKGSEMAKGLVRQDDRPKELPTMVAEVRAEKECGKRGAYWLRVGAMTPAVLYAAGRGQRGRGERELLKVDTRMINKEIKKYESSFESRVYELTIKRSEEAAEEAVARGDWFATVDTMREYKELVLPVDTGFHPESMLLVKVNFIRFRPGRRCRVPIRFINDDLNDELTKGTFISRRRSHQYIVLPENPLDIPPYLDVDMEHVKLRDKLRVSDLIIPEGIKICNGEDPKEWNAVVAVVKGKTLTPEEIAEDEAAAAAAAEQQQ